MYERELTQKIKDGLAHNAAVALLGPRQIGKTTLALDISKTTPSVYLDLEDPDDFQKLQNPVEYADLHADKLIILDEVQRYPDLFMSLRGIIDQRRREGRGEGRFLLLGSATNELLQQSSESLAGRISYLELSGLNPFEVEVKNSATLQKLWLRGGFPRSFSAKDDKASDAWRKDFIRTYLERDIPQLGPRIPAATLMRFWTMLAHTQGENFNASKLASSLDVSSVTVSRYLDLMVDLLLVRKLEPWHGNVKKRLVKAPRVYVRDSGILHHLLRISDYENLLSNPVLGKSWEGFVIENILSALPHRVHPFYYRTAAGAEIDLLLEVAHQKYWAVEIKAGQRPDVEKGFYAACDDLKVERKFVIYGGQDIFPMGDGVTAMPLIEFLRELGTLK